MQLPRNVKPNPISRSKFKTTSRATALLVLVTAGLFTVVLPMGEAQIAERHRKPGPPGPPGPPGAPAIENYADFFALMPPDNAATVAAGSPVGFPQDGPTNSVIARASASTFVLPAIGTYQVTFGVSVDEAGQLVLALDSGAGFVELGQTVVGRATGTSQIVGTFLIQTTVTNSIIEVRNPAANSTALTITPLAGGTQPVSAHLVITEIRLPSPP